MTNHKMSALLIAECGADDGETVITWAAVTCSVCRYLLAQQEISDDVAAGVVPASVTTFAELHDYVDANGYGGLFEVADDALETHDSLPEWIQDMAIETQDHVDAWLRGGGLNGNSGS